MEALVNKVKGELNNYNSHQDGSLEKVIVIKSQKINELENKLRVLEDRITRLSAERDQLIAISSELRADLNRQQRLVSELMVKQPD